MLNRRQQLYAVLLRHVRRLAVRSLVVRPQRCPMSICQEPLILQALLSESSSRTISSPALLSVSVMCCWACPPVGSTPTAIRWPAASSNPTHSIPSFQNWENHWPTPCYAHIVAICTRSSDSEGISRTEIASSKASRILPVAASRGTSHAYFHRDYKL